MKPPASLLLATLAALTTAADPTPYCPPRSATTAQQTTIFTEFINTFLILKDPKTAFLRHISIDYIQHNPYALSGRQVAIDGLVPFIPRNNYTILNKAMQNNVGFVHYKSVGPGMDGRGKVTSVIVDVLRFEGTCIVEHWDLMGVKMGNETNPLAYF